ncbi:hypothetical protein DCAR_0103705 [Daucus carota subsp. sativus]|uniref:Epidermal patterning factor-like protein n=1 Tax=Daucus carota subsp. sativus TaxID=79200 RepID=A0AAF0W972_DAUCS|nr:hypothetical protein DCAR_0103705 [Daucus carota subsp. sativus]
MSYKIILLKFLFKFYLFEINITNSIMNLVSAEKSRLGSTPPSCHNKCNQCHPCMAVQVPAPPRPLRATRFDPSSPGNNYSNYKPLSWKCRCNNHLYNP